MSKKTRKYLHSQMALTKGGLPNSIIFRCSPLGIGVKQMKIIEFSTFSEWAQKLMVKKTPPGHVPVAPN
jgi:hypothetical protein